MGTAHRKGEGQATGPGVCASDKRPEVSVRSWRFCWRGCDIERPVPLGNFWEVFRRK